jgi:UDPglucose 6-dehydrogenase
MTGPRSPPPTVGIVGLGYMGLATGLAFAARGLSVTGYDVKPEVRERTARGDAPYHEAGLEELLRSQLRAGRFSVVGHLSSLVDASECLFVCLPTPSLRSGGIDLRPLTRGITELGGVLRGAKGYRLVVVKSTVVPGTTEHIVEPLLRRLSGRAPHELGVAVNPEFLAEGSAVRDAVRPDRVVIGTGDVRARARMRAAYRRFRVPSYYLPPSAAELVKYSSNAFLALKVSFANEISRLAEALGLDIDDVMEAVGADPRIGRRFLHAGPGFGGSCFEKDVRALVVRSRELGFPLRTGEVSLTINREQEDHMLALVRGAVGPLRGKTIAVLGAAFKAGTDDVRGSRAFPLVAGLLKEGARVRVHDPVALGKFRQAWEQRSAAAPRSVEFRDTVLQVLVGADAAVLQADWAEYRSWRPAWTRRMKTPLLVDLRRSIPVRSPDTAGLRIRALGVGSAREPSPAARSGRTHVRGGRPK